MIFVAGEKLYPWPTWALIPEGQVHVFLREETERNQDDRFKPFVDFRNESSFASGSTYSVQQVVLGNLFVRLS